MKNSTQETKEAKYTLLIYLAYFVWSIGTAYGMGSSPVEKYTYILGFPAWFFFSCIVGYPLCCVSVYFLIQKVFSKNNALSDGENT